MECEFCKHTFTSKSILNMHKKTAKYCIILQNKENKYFICKFCNKEFSQQVSLDYHFNICKEQKEHLHNKDKEKYDKIINKLEIKIYDLELEIKNNKEKYEIEIKNMTNEHNKKILEQQQIFHEKENKYKNELIKALNDKSEKYIKLAIKKPTTNITQINNKIEKLEILTDKHMKEQVQNLTIEHVEKGVSGYVEYALQNVFKNKLVCSDASRKIVKYKADKDTVVTDNGMKIANKFFLTILEKNNELSGEIISNIPSDTDVVEHAIKITNTRQNSRMVKESANGLKNKLSTNFKTILCNKLSNTDNLPENKYNTIKEMTNNDNKLNSVLEKTNDRYDSDDDINDILKEISDDDRNDDVKDNKITYVKPEQYPYPYPSQMIIENSDTDKSENDMDGDEESDTENEREKERLENYNESLYEDDDIDKDE